MSDQGVKTSTERKADPQDQPYILAPGAPAHYVAGYGRCVGGDIVGLPKGVEAGHYYHKITAEQAGKARYDAAFKAELERDAAAAVAKKPDPRTAYRQKLLKAAEAKVGSAVVAPASQKAVAEAEAAAAKAKDDAEQLSAKLADLEAEKAALEEQNRLLADRNAELESAGENPPDQKAGKAGK